MGIKAPYPPSPYPSKGPYDYWGPQAASTVRRKRKHVIGLWVVASWISHVIQHDLGT